MSTSDSVDRVFTHALATVRRLPRTGSSRPPPSARLRLYGLYKQSMEGDVAAILPRPVLPLPPSPPPTQQDHFPTNRPSIDSTLSGDDNTNNNESSPSPAPLTRQTSSTSQTQTQQQPSQVRQNSSNTVHRFASRDLRTREAQAEIEKWDAWHACAGMGRTEAKRRYIEALIGTMKEYASGTSESRELVGELEFVWGQIRSQSGGSGGSGGSGSEGRVVRKEGSSGEDDEGESPRRSGLLGLAGSGSNQETRTRASGGSQPRSKSKQKRRRPREELASDGGRLRVLSPMSPRGSGSEIVEGRDADDDIDSNNDEIPNDDLQHTRPTRLSALEAQLRHLSTEIAALREQLSANHLLASSSFSSRTHPNYRTLPLKWKVYYTAKNYLRWIISFAVRQALVGATFLVGLILWQRWKGGNRRAEEWARRRWKDLRALVERSGLEDWVPWLMTVLKRRGRAIGL
ncbi:Autophagy-related protein 37 [Cyphellophora attinorum]|uniref:Autophagy-related protein 37 n=1 Tax=Cyphellophora attinorum TaxID=1664694 RepID=A0A0N0NJ76_9EURO|nr:Autophagy-related protein 37 [Phialophora attinorum]KPI36661.1 Autophagy-related protein 37 [Phialophora attinorum]